MAELFTLRPLFPGSSEADQIYKICSIMGSPTMRTWGDGIKLAAAMNFRSGERSDDNEERIDNEERRDDH